MGFEILLVWPSFRASSTAKSLPDSGYEYLDQLGSHSTCPVDCYCESAISGVGVGCQSIQT